MSVLKRAALVLAAALSAGGAVNALAAQIQGMPLFTNPRYGTGIRVHADIGQPTEQGSSLGDLTVIQAGVSLALGPVGIGANVGSLRANLEESQQCANQPTLDCEDNYVTASALAQIRVAGGGRQNLSLSVFGGASTDITAYDIAGVEQPRLLTIPVGAAIGLRIPLGLASLSLWGAPRLNVYKFVNCATGQEAICDETETKFRWAVGADVPIFRIISVRAAFDSGKVGDETVSFWGVGASIGIGGMR
jgi:hypothetical protein